MTAIDVLVFVLLALFCYVLVWALIDRVCKCCEKCAYLKAFGEFMENGNAPMMPPNAPTKKKKEENGND